MKTELGIALFVMSFAGIVQSSHAQLTPQQAQPPRTITVTGVSEVEVVPDQAVLSLSIATFDKDLAAGKSRHDQRAKELQDVAVKLGVLPSDIQSSRIAISTERSERGKPKNVSLASSMTIHLRDLTRYDELLSALLTAGVQSMQSVEFTVSEKPKYKEQARLLAVRTARDQAAAMAGAVGQRIGNPLAITEMQAEETPQASSPWQYGDYRIGRFYSTFFPNIAAKEKAPESSEAPATEAVAPGKIVFRMRVTATFELQ